MTLLLLYLLKANAALVLLSGLYYASAHLPCPEQVLPAVCYELYSGKRAPLAAVEQLDAKTIAGVAVLKGAGAARVLHGTAQPVVVITTQAGGTSPEAKALAARLPREKQVPESYLSAEALAYLVKTYPGYRLTGVWEVATQGQPVGYRAEIAKGRRPLSVLFDEQGRALTR